MQCDVSLQRVLGLWIRDYLAKFIFLDLGSICSLGLNYFHIIFVLLYLEVSPFGLLKNAILNVFMQKKKKLKLLFYIIFVWTKLFVLFVM